MSRKSECCAIVFPDRKIYTECSVFIEFNISGGFSVLSPWRTLRCQPAAYHTLWLAGKLVQLPLIVVFFTSSFPSLIQLALYIHHCSNVIHINLPFRVQSIFFVGFSPSTLFAAVCTKAKRRQRLIYFRINRQMCRTIDISSLTAHFSSTAQLLLNFQLWNLKKKAIL